jgi:hypothetical protein
MNSQEVALNTGNQMIIHTTIAKVFLWNRRSQPGQINNSDLYDPETYPEGTVMGRISATGLLAPFTSGASNGSQFPIGVLVGTHIVEEGATNNVFICDDGDVAAEQLIFQGSDDLDTVVSGRQVRDWLKLAGVKVITSTDLTGHDND